MKTTNKTRLSNQNKYKYRQLMTEYGERLEDNRRYQRDLLDEASKAAFMREEVEDSAERDHWEREEEILDSLFELSLQEHDKMLKDMKYDLSKFEPVCC